MAGDLPATPGARSAVGEWVIEAGNPPEGTGIYLLSTPGPLIDDKEPPNDRWHSGCLLLR